MRFRSKWVQEDELGGFLHQEAVGLGSEVVALDRLEGRRCVADNRGQSSRPCPALQHRCSNATGWQQGFVELGWGLGTGSKAAGAALSRRDGSASPYSISAPWGLYCRLSPPSRSPEVGGGLLQSTLAVMSAGAGLTEGLCAGLQAVQRAQPGSRCGSVGLEEAPVTHSSPGTESFA